MRELVCLHVVRRAAGRADDAAVLVDHLQELANDDRHRLNSLHLLFRAQVLALQISLFFFDVVFLHTVFNQTTVVLEQQNNDTQGVFWWRDVLERT